MKRSEKEQILSEVSEVVGKATAMYLTDFTGLTVEEVTELRREFRKSGIDYKVSKNTLIRRALESAGGYEELSAKLVGPTGIAYAYDDPVMPAKIIKKFVDKHNKLSLKAAIVEKQVYDGSRLGELSSLPNRTESIAGILGCIQSPLAGVPVVMNAIARDLVSVIGEIEKKKAA
ncbi:MAG: 50S ribosomal protein L10 [Ignavibacteria bacterium]|nr:50S ribosomal protein L10 [Ignavibacteria bacterium]